MTLIEWSWIIFFVYTLYFIASYYAAQSKPSFGVLMPILLIWIVKNTVIVLFALSTELWGFLGIVGLDVFAYLLATLNIRKEVGNGNIKV